MTSTTFCNSTATGEIGVGDCAFSDGTRYDDWRFQGTSNQLVTIRLTTLDSTYTTPLIELLPPLGDASKTPAIAGVSPLILRYRLSSTGPWTIGVETADLQAGGRYSLTVTCDSGSDPSVPQNCVTQSLACGQTFDWDLTATSCQFEGSQRPYAYFNIPMTAGDTVNFAVHSDAFDPALAVYRGGGAPLASGFGRRFSPDATVTFTAMATTNHQVAVYPGQGVTGGRFILTTKCIAVCGAPTFNVQPLDAHVPYGGSVTLFAGAGAPSNSPVSIEWYETTNPLGSIGSGPSLELKNLTRTAAYFARASTPCGSTNSRQATVKVDQQPRRRTVRH